MRTVLITGGSSGIGAATARKFAQESYNVAFSFNTNAEGAAQVVGEIEEAGAQAFSFQAELSREAEAKALIDAVLEKFGGIDVLVNNAGRYIEGDEWNGTEEIWSQTLAQNLISVMSVSKYCLPVFEKQQSGVIVNVASRLGLSGNYEELAYGAAKAGVINVTQAYAKLLAPYGRANSVSPGAVEAGYWLTAPQEELEARVAKKPQKRLTSPEEVVDVIYFLASDEARNINGENRVVD